MSAIIDAASYWDDYATRRPARSPVEALAAAFGWTQYAGHGPGVELLGEPASTLELGCSHGDAVAALAAQGVEATGVDVSPAMVASAQARWGHLPDAAFVEADMLAYLAEVDRQWEAVYSIWGAPWFTDPALWMPLVWERLTVGGRLVLAWAPPVPGCYGRQGMYGAGFSGLETWICRWAYEPETWAEMLTGCGFREVRAWVEPAPTPGHVGTLFVQATA